MKSFVLMALLASATEGAKIQEFDLSPNAFANASVSARMQTDQQIKNSGKQATYAQNNEIWKGKFTKGAFYQQYQKHLA
jgi:hypothetical protein